MQKTSMPVEQKRWLNPDDLEIEFGISKNNQARIRSNSDIPYSKRGKYVYYDREKINKWLEDAEMVS